MIAQEIPRCHASSVSRVREVSAAFGSLFRPLIENIHQSGFRSKREKCLVLVPPSARSATTSKSGRKHEDGTGDDVSPPAPLRDINLGPQLVRSRRRDAPSLTKGPRRGNLEGFDDLGVCFRVVFRSTYLSPWAKRKFFQMKGLHTSFHS